MSKVELREATEPMLKEIASLADLIWHEHYTAIIGLNQVEYMVSHFQTVEAMRQQIEKEHFHYYGIYVDDQLSGYTAVVAHEGYLFLSKLYLKEETRGRGVGHEVFEQLKVMAGSCHDKIMLTVNRFNTKAFACYIRWGFISIRTEKTPIGSGYYMDDYVMLYDGAGREV